MTGKTAGPAALYGGLALSTNNVQCSYACPVRDRMTDAAGRSMNLTALNLVAKVDAVAGDIPGPSGDQQIRMYSAPA